MTVECFNISKLKGNIINTNLYYWDNQKSPRCSYEIQSSLRNRLIADNHFDLFSLFFYQLDLRVTATFRGRFYSNRLHVK